MGVTSVTGALGRVACSLTLVAVTDVGRVGGDTFWVGVRGLVFLKKKGGRRVLRDENDRRASFLGPRV